MSKEEFWAERLLCLGYAVQRHVAQMWGDADDDLVAPVAHEGGDTVFAIDRKVEPILKKEIEAWPVDCLPLLVIVEGIGDDGRLTFGESAPLYRLIVDPIDGTRGLMYDKRSAWFIASIADDHGEDTSLRDSFASVLVELPTSKQGACDAFSATINRPTRGYRTWLGCGERRSIQVRPSKARDLEFGFGQVSNFFPGTKVLASDLMERIALKSCGVINSGQASVFDDQYLSTGGQMVELMLGHDRFCCDLRPLFYRILEIGKDDSVRGLECHPYDVAGALVAHQAGVVITDGFGNPLNAPLDVETGVHWCGYANDTLREQIQPVIDEWLAEHGVCQGTS